MHLDDFQFGEKRLFSKILDSAGVSTFFWCLGRVKKSLKKTKAIGPKITGLERRSSGTVFGPFLVHFLQISKHKNTVKYNLFAALALTT